jgi:hypothetical protein
MCLLPFLLIVMGCEPNNVSYLYQQNPPIPVRPLNTLPGLLCNVYDLSATQPSTMPVFTANPSQTSLIGSPQPVYAGSPIASYSMSGAIDFNTSQTILAGSGQTVSTWFALDCIGKIYIDNEIAYEVELSSDDGSQLLMDNIIVVNNDGIHGTQSVTGSIVLSPGPHSVELRYFQGPGVASLELSSNLTMVFYQ